MMTQSRVTDMCGRAAPDLHCAGPFPYNDFTVLHNAGWIPGEDLSTLNEIGIVQVRSWSAHRA